MDIKKQGVIGGAAFAARRAAAASPFGLAAGRHSPAKRRPPITPCFFISKSLLFTQWRLYPDIFLDETRHKIRIHAPLR